MSVDVKPQLLYGITFDADEMREIIKAWDFSMLTEDCRGYNCDVPEPEDRDDLDLFLRDFTDQDLAGLIAYHYGMPDPEPIGSAYSGDIDHWFCARLDADDDVKNPHIAVDSESLDVLMKLVNDAGLGKRPQWKLDTYWW